MKQYLVVLYSPDGNALSSDITIAHREDALLRRIELAVRHRIFAQRGVAYRVGRKEPDGIALHPVAEWALPFNADN